MATRKLLPFVVLLGYALAACAYAPVWHDELTLWLHVAPLAPQKPRPWINLALALMERQRLAEAQAALDHVAVLVTAPRLSADDRAEAVHALTTNRLVLARLANAGGPQ